MKFGLIIILFGCFLNLLFSGEIKIPLCAPERSLAYLSSKLGLKIIYPNFDTPKVFEFVFDNSDVDNVLKQYQLRNENFLKLEFLKDTYLLLCYEKKYEKEQKEYLESKLVYEPERNIYVVLEEIKFPLEICLVTKDDNDKIKNYFKELILNQPSITLF